MGILRYTGTERNIRQMKKQILFALMLIVLVSGCKKAAVCPSSITASVGGTAYNWSCGGSTLLDSNLFVFGHRPNQATVSPQYDLFIRFEKKVGVQLLDSTCTVTMPSKPNIDVYYYSNPVYKKYSLCGSNAHAIITVTNIDTLVKSVQGIFSGVLIQQGSSADSIQITNGSFSLKYSP